MMDLMLKQVKQHPVPAFDPISVSADQRNRRGQIGLGQALAVCDQTLVDRGLLQAQGI